MTYSAAKVTFFFHPIRQFLCRKLVILCQIPKPSFWQRGSVKHLDQINVYQRHILHFLLLRVQFQSWNEKELKRDVLSCRLSNTLIETCPSPRFMILAGLYRNVPFLYVDNFALALLCETYRRYVDLCSRAFIFWYIHVGRPQMHCFIFMVLGWRSESEYITTLRHNLTLLMHTSTG